MAASFVAWLLGGTNVNPLPAHYYCPVCKKVEFVSGAACGLDLEEKRCSCGSEYRKDGFGIDAVNMYPFSKWNEIYVSNNVTGLVKECLHEFFKGYGEIREIQIIDDKLEEDFRIMDEASILTVLENVEENISCRNLLNAVDFKLISLLKKGDICVSQDYGVAAMALGKGCDTQQRHICSKQVFRLL